MAGSTGTVGRLLVARVLLGRAASSDKRQLDVGVGLDKVGEAVLDVGETPFDVVEGKPSRGSSEVAAADDVLLVPFLDVGKAEVRQCVTVHRYIHGTAESSSRPNSHHMQFMAIRESCHK